MISAAFLSIVGNAAADHGGCDAFGYEWTDSKSPSPTVSYNWIEINSTGTASTIAGDDQFGGPYAIGFTFSFYGNAYTQLYFSTNGLITFGSGSSSYSNSPIPTTFAPNNFLAPFWDDLYIGTGVGTAYYQMIGSAPDRQFVVEWDKVRTLGGSNLFTFEAILNETGDIWFQYNSMNGVTGGSATVGMENATGLDGSQYSYDLGSISDSLAIRFSLGPFSIGPSQSQSGVPGTTVSYALTIRNRQAFADSFDLNSTSVYGWSVSFYDSAGTVLLSDTNGDSHGYPDTGNIPAGGSLSITVKVVIPSSPGGNPDIENIIATSYNNNALNRITSLTTRFLPAQFYPPHSDNGWDTNADGLYEYLVVDVSVNITMADYYEIGGTLRDSMFNFMGNEYNWTYLDVGIRTVELRFDGWQIYNHAVNGPYTVSLSLYDGSFALLGTDTYATNAYTWSQFQPSSSFYPPHGDYGLDVDADGLYDYLIVDVSVNITSVGNYEIDGTLRDSMFNLIDSESNYTFLSAGIQTVELRFDGHKIYKHSVNGPYAVYLSLYDNSMNLLDTDTYNTNTYPFDSFNSTVATILSQWAEVSPAVDGSFTPGEWVDAASVNLTAVDPNNDLPAILLVKNDADYLYICYDGIGDTTQDTSDGASVAFDTGNDNLLSDGGEDQFTLVCSPLNNGTHYIYSTGPGWIVDCSPFNTALPNHTGLAGAFGFGSSDNTATNHRIYEFRIPLALLNVTPGDIIGFLGASQAMPGIMDTMGGYSTWPIYFGGPPPLSEYGVILLAANNQPQIDYVQIRDASNGAGSLIDNITLDRGETKSLWCAGYNYTSGYVGDCLAIWISNNMSIATVTSPGASTNLMCNSSNIGTTTITVNHNGKVDTAIINVRDLPHTTAFFYGALGANGWYISSVRVNLSASDIMEGVNYTMYRVDAGSWMTYGTTFDVISEGQHTISYYSVDNGNNTEKTNSFTVKIDLTPPTLSITQANGTIFTATSVVISWNGSDVTSGIDHYEMSLDGAAFQHLDATTMSKNLTNLSPGDHYLVVRAVDRSGLVTERRIDFKVSTGISEPGSTFLADMWPWLLLLSVVTASLLILFLIFSRRRKKDGESTMIPQMPPQVPPPAQYPLPQNPPSQPPPQTPFP